MDVSAQINPEESSKCSNQFIRPLTAAIVVAACSNSPSLSHIFFLFSFFLHTPTFQLLDKPWSQVSPRVLPSTFIAHRVQQSHCSSIFHRVLLTHALALSASQFVHKKKKNTNSYEYAHSGGFKLTKLTYTTAVLYYCYITPSSQPETKHLARSIQCLLLAPCKGIVESIEGFTTDVKPLCQINALFPVRQRQPHQDSTRATESLLRAGVLILFLAENPRSHSVVCYIRII